MSVEFLNFDTDTILLIESAFAHLLKLSLQNWDSCPQNLHQLTVSRVCHNRPLVNIYFCRLISRGDKLFECPSVNSVLIDSVKALWFSNIVQIEACSIDVKS